MLTRLANHRTNLVNLERRRSELAARVQKAQLEADLLDARAAELQKQRDELAQKLAEAQKLHDSGKHADSVKTANEALALLGVKPAEKK